MDGIFNIFKPSGLTSHDVVNVVRRLSRQRRVGHAGTLDPDADGVLVVCLGKATKVIEFLVEDSKAYLADITLGISTDTYDASGQITAQVPVKATRRQIVPVVAAFRGEILQVPPIFSAIKQGGRPLYKLARAGIAVQPPARKVTIYKLDIVKWHTPNLRLEIECSKGTYIRSLAHDLGQRLGCGAHLSHLTRLRSGRFDATSAVTLDDLRVAFEEDTAEDLLFALDEALLDHDAVIVREEKVAVVVNGTAWPASAEPSGLVGDHRPVRVYSVRGDIVAMARYDKSLARWTPSKVF